MNADREPLTRFERELGLTLAMGAMTRHIDAQGRVAYDFQVRDGVDIDAIHYRHGAFVPDRLIRRPIGIEVNPADPANVLMRAAGREGLALRVVVEA